jgi:ADP-heptose:LPS heptosyltransferase
MEIRGNPEVLVLFKDDLPTAKFRSAHRTEMAALYQELGPDPEVLVAGLIKLLQGFRRVVLFSKKTNPLVLKNLALGRIEEILTVPSHPGEGDRRPLFELQRESLMKAGIPYPPEPYQSLGWPETVEPKAFWAAIHPGSGSPRKNWPSGNFLECADHLRRYGPLLWIFGPADEEIFPHFQKAIEGYGDALLYQAPLGQVAASLKQARSYIGNDSGITHVAASLGNPTVALFGPTNPLVWRPWGKRVSILWKGADGLTEITVPEVLRALKRLFPDQD